MRLPFRYCFVHQWRPRYFRLNFAVLCALTVVLLFYYTFIMCTTRQVTTDVNLFCKLHQAGQIAGNLCDDLCIHRSLVLGTCDKNHLAKEVVFEAMWKNEKVVIKSQYLDPTQYDSIIMHNEGKVLYPSTVEFVEMVANHIKFNLNISLGMHNKQGATNLLTKLWSLDFNDFIETGSVESAMNSIWSLIQQNEYVLMKYFEKQNVFPKVLGSCGHFYAIEYVKPMDTRNWTARVNHALQLLDLTTQLETLFHQPLHLCDIKAAHFGTDSQNRLKVIDVDTAYFQSVINKMIATDTRCSTDTDCSFWDCQARCHPKTRTCHHGVTNNNLQMICRKVFQGKTAQSVLLKPFEDGLLLQSAKTDRILQELLDDCANPNHNFRNDLAQSGASIVIKERLQLLLQVQLGITST